MEEEGRLTPRPAAPEAWRCSGCSVVYGMGEIRCSKCMVTRDGTKIIEPLQNEKMEATPPMVAALDRVWKRLACPDRLELRANLSGLKKTMGSELFKVATACSGSDVIIPTLENVLDCFSQELGIRFDMEHLFSCENVEFKQKWIEEHFGDDFTLFPDLARLAEVQTEDVGGRLVRIPQAFLYIVGAECDSVSGLNNNRAENYPAACGKPRHRASPRYIV